MLLPQLVLPELLRARPAKSAPLLIFASPNATVSSTSNFTPHAPNPAPVELGISRSSLPLSHRSSRPAAFGLETWRLLPRLARSSATSQPPCPHGNSRASDAYGFSTRCLLIRLPSPLGCFRASCHAPPALHLCSAPFLWSRCKRSSRCRVLHDDLPAPSPPPRPVVQPCPCFNPSAILPTRSTATCGSCDRCTPGGLIRPRKCTPHAMQGCRKPAVTQPPVWGTARPCRMFSAEVTVAGRLVPTSSAPRSRYTGKQHTFLMMLNPAYAFSCQVSNTMGLASQSASSHPARAGSEQFTCD